MEVDGAGGSASAPQAEPNQAKPPNPAHPFDGGPKRWEGPVLATPKTRRACVCTLWRWSRQIILGRTTAFPTMFPTDSPNMFPAHFPTDSRRGIVSRPVPSQEIVYSRSIPSTKWLPTFPSHSHPAVNKREHFPIPSLGKTLFFPPVADETVPYRTAPRAAMAYKVPLWDADDVKSRG